MLDCVFTLHSKNAILILNLWELMFSASKGSAKPYIRNGFGF